MALTPETGAGLPNADSLCDIAFADTFHADRNNVTWAALNTQQKEGALRRATDFIQSTYRTRWAGYRNTETQALDWPRSWVERRDCALTGTGYYPNDAVPLEVKQATATLALKAHTSDLKPDIGRLKKSATVGPISVSYVEGGSPSTQYRSATDLLRPFLRPGSGNSIALVRA